MRGVGGSVGALALVGIADERGAGDGIGDTSLGPAAHPLRPAVRTIRGPTAQRVPRGRPVMSSPSRKGWSHSKAAGSALATTRPSPVTREGRCGEVSSWPAPTCVGSHWLLSTSPCEGWDGVGGYHAERGDNEECYAADCLDGELLWAVFL